MSDNASRASRFERALLTAPAPAAVVPVRTAVVPAAVHGGIGVGGAADSPTALVTGPVRPSGRAPGVLPVEYRHVVELRRQVADLLAQQSAASPGMSAEDRQQLGRSLVRQVVGTWATTYAAAERPLDRDDEQLLRRAVFDELFRAGRLQPLLDDPEVENIIIAGHDDVRVDYRDRPSRKVGAVAESDADLIDLVNQLVRTQGQGERALTPASPMLNTRLGDGSRLAATAWVTHQPEVVIRRHRTRTMSLEDLERLGSIDSTLVEFLRAAVRARKNIVFAGSQGVGKTSLMRAACREIPASERVGTLEGEYELWLHEDEGGPTIVAFEAREGNGERGPDGRAAGEITLDEMFRQALRMSLRRTVVGEVRSHEVLPMLHAMNEGEGGSMCTVHARTAEGAIERLVMLCLEARAQMTDALAYRLIANAIDFVVYVRLVDETAIGGSRHRFVSHVVEITGTGEGGRPSRQTVFGPREEGERREVRAVPVLAPQCLPDLVRAGLRRETLQRPWGTWRTPLHTLEAV